MCRTESLKYCPINQPLFQSVPETKKKTKKKKKTKNFLLGKCIVYYI